MSDLYHIIYCSKADEQFNQESLARLLWQARINNTRLGLSGMLLYADRTFFQVIEGEKAILDALFHRIEHDKRHHEVTTIIYEPIPERAFSDWRMAYADVPENEVLELFGSQPFATPPDGDYSPVESRAKKLLEAFKQGKWRKTLSDQSAPRLEHVPQYPPAHAEKPCRDSGYSFAFQPILNVDRGEVYAVEGLIRGNHGEPASTVLDSIRNHPTEHAESLVQALLLAAHLGITCRLSLNLAPTLLSETPYLLKDLKEVIHRTGMAPEQLILEILENELIPDYAGFRHALIPYRQAGFRIAIDDFGTGFAGLNFLAQYQPDYLKLDRGLISDIHHHGPKQAIVRGVITTCKDLGITLIAEGVEGHEEFDWLQQQGVQLFQGYHFGKPAFERLPAT